MADHDAAARQLAAVTLAATLGIQIFTSLAATCAAVLAPTIAGEFHVQTRWVGVYVGVVYAGAMAASLASGGFIERYGAIRTSQACVVMSIAGVALMALAPPSAPMLLAVAALVIGVGYGPITPASSQLLVRTARPDRMSLTFSIKQTGVPAGAALAGALLPSLAHAIGWRAAFGIVAATGIAVALAAQPIQAALDTDRRKGRRMSLTAALAPLVHLRVRALRQLAIISFAYAATQVCLTSFLVVYLTEVMDYPLVLAGLALSVATVGGVVGRIVWGVIADRRLAARRTLVLIGALAAACGVGLALAQPAWPTIACLALAAVFGATAIGWNGVQLAEIARLAPRGAAGAVTGATGFVGFSGVVLGPTAFTAIVALSGSYRAGWLTFAGVSAAGAAWLVLSARTRATVV
jgi:MFS family permease